MSVRRETVPMVTGEKPHRYANRSLVPGDEFLARPEDVRVLEALKRAKRKEGGKDPKKATRTVQPVHQPTVEPVTPESVARVRTKHSKNEGTE